MFFDILSPEDSNSLHKLRVIIAIKAKQDKKYLYLSAKIILFPLLYRDIYDIFIRFVWQMKSITTFLKHNQTSPVNPDYQSHPGVNLTKQSIARVTINIISQIKWVVMQESPQSDTLNWCFSKL